MHDEAVGSVKQAFTVVTSVDRVDIDPNWLGIDVDALKISKVLHGLEEVLKSYNKILIRK